MCVQLSVFSYLFLPKKQEIQNEKPYLTAIKLCSIQTTFSHHNKLDQRQGHLCQSSYQIEMAAMQLKAGHPCLINSTVKYSAF